MSLTRNPVFHYWRCQCLAAGRQNIETGRLGLANNGLLRRVFLSAGLVWRRPGSKFGLTSRLGMLPDGGNLGACGMHAPDLQVYADAEDHVGFWLLPFTAARAVGSKFFLNAQQIRRFRVGRL